MSEGARVVTVSSGTVARVVLVGAAVWGLANLLWLGRDAVFVAMLAGLVSLYLSFWTDLLLGRFPRLKRGFAAALVLLLSLALLVVLGWLLWPTLREQLSTVRSELPRAIDRVSDWATGLLSSVGTETARVPDVEQQLQQRLSQEASRIVGGALPLLNTVMGGLFAVFVIIAAGLFLAVDPHVYRAGLVRLLPATGRRDFANALTEVASTLRWWMVGTGISMSIIAVATTLALWAIGMPGFVALGVLAGLLQFIPNVGPVISAIPAVLLALVVAPSKVVWVILLYAGIQLIESNVLTPLVMKKAVHVPPALSILFQTLMAIVFGFLGLLLAVPILAATLVLINRLDFQADMRRRGRAAHDDGGAGEAEAAPG